MFLFTWILSELVSRWPHILFVFSCVSVRVRPQTSVCPGEPVRGGPPSRQVRTGATRPQSLEEASGCSRLDPLLPPYPSGSSKPWTTCVTSGCRLRVCKWTHRRWSSVRRVWSMRGWDELRSALMRNQVDDHKGSFFITLRIHFLFFLQCFLFDFIALFKTIDDDDDICTMSLWEYLSLMFCSWF